MDIPDEACTCGDSLLVKYMSGMGRPWARGAAKSLGEFDVQRATRRQGIWKRLSTRLATFFLLRREEIFSDNFVYSLLCGRLLSESVYRR